jgi:hypothetical protein
MPGEHHFVAVYLIPKLFQLNGIVPDYVNPDGTKGLIGDVIYYKDGAHRCGVEVKLGTIRLTKNEFNKWIVGNDKKYWPNVFLGVGSAGLVLLTWPEFRTRYLQSVRATNPSWTPAVISDGYGPVKSVNALLATDERAGRFAISADPKVAQKRESKFLNALKHAVGC